MQAEQQGSRENTDADSVLQYLTRNPDFFNQHSDVLPRLAIPHHTGAAVSLIEKQVSVLRNKCCTLENSLRDLINVARENEQLHQRLHRLIQDIISASTLNDVAALTRENMLENFNADDVKVVLFSSEKDAVETAAKEQDAHYSMLASNDPGIALFKDLYRKCETKCGPMTNAQREMVFGAEAKNVASAAMIPLKHSRKLGVVILASSDKERFALGKGVMFLNQLGDVLSRRIDSLL